MKTQKTHKHGNDGNRFFWNVKTDNTEGIYRSRHASAKGVRTELEKNGHKVMIVKAVKA